MRLLASLGRRALKEYPEAQLRDHSRTERLPLASARWVHRTPFPEPLVTRAVLPRAARVLFNAALSFRSPRAACTERGRSVQGFFLAITRSSATKPGGRAAWRVASCARPLHCLPSPSASAPADWRRSAAPHGRAVLRRL